MNTCKGTVVQNSIVSVWDSSDHGFAAKTGHSRKRGWEGGKGHIRPLGLSLNSTILFNHPNSQCQETLHLGLHPPFTALLMPNSYIKLINQMFWEIR